MQQRAAKLFAHLGDSVKSSPQITEGLRSVLWGVLWTPLRLRNLWGILWGNLRSDNGVCSAMFSKGAINVQLCSARFNKGQYCSAKVLQGFLGGKFKDKIKDS